ncbi:molecular chaperone TorD family protein [Acidobacteriia bacterium AH_259_A11_L15]|nr:molecular chaperone TorD family protein [Acidobacteriia bacterium AH_259_A11_L15]
MEAQALELAPLLARRELWLLLSVAFVDPYHRQRFEILRDPELRRRTREAAALVAREQRALELGPGEVDPKTLSPGELFGAFEAHCPTLERTYRELFGLTAVSPCCPACEVEYEPSTELSHRSQRLADVAAFYNGFGLQVAGRAGERLDHITVEAEFLYILLAKEAAARQSGNQEGAEVCRDARGKFFQEHVGWWLPAFARVLRRAAPAGYYRELASFTAGLSALERVSLGLSPFRVPIIPKPSGVGAEAACFACRTRP